MSRKAEAPSPEELDERRRGEGAGKAEWACALPFEGDMAAGEAGERAVGDVDGCRSDECK